MKPLILYLILGLFALGTLPLSAQTTDLTVTVNGDHLCKDTVARLKLFTAKSVDGKVYLHWNVSHQSKDGVYIIYRSEDGQNYEVAGQKNGIGTPLPLDIAYYFTDDFPSRGILHYKIMHLSEEMTFLASESVTVEGSVKNMVSAAKSK